MNEIKAKQFTDSQIEMAKLAKALGHPARIAIIEYLLNVDTCICGDIVDQIPLAQPTVSQHLKALKNVGLIKGSIAGNTICYCVDKTNLEKLNQFVQHLSSQTADRNECC